MIKNKECKKSMKRKGFLKFIFKKKWMHLLLTAVIVISVVTLNSVSANADTAADKTTLDVTASPCTYLSLGDSIAYGMSAASGSDYVHLFYNHLITNPNYNQLGLNNLAVCGDTSSNLLSRLQTDSSYTAAVKNAKVITISIGGNNLLSPVISTVCTAFGVNPVKNSNLMAELAKAIVNNPNSDTILGGIAGSPTLAKALQSNISQFGIDLPKIIGMIKTISPQAQIYVLSLYNPFNSRDLLYTVVDPLINGINKVINTNAASSYKVADVYTKFKTTAGAVNFDLAAFKLDPHPTTIGHKAIYETVLGAESEKMPAAYYINKGIAGIIKDSSTGKVINGAEVTLYYADTKRNRAAGKTSDTKAALPAIDGSGSSNPQKSDASGAYGFMVYPDTDYYIAAEKDGYENYKSPTISVQKEIVKLDFKMNKPVTGVNRLSGESRADTAIEIAKAEYAGKVKNVILATAGNYPDALSGSVLAYKLNAPVLLVGGTDRDMQKVIDYMKSNMDTSGTVYILGGTGVIGSAAENKIISAGFGSIIRLGGTDKYGTAVKIAESLNAHEGTPIVLVSGDNYPDALSISSEAAEMGMPILLVRKDGMSDVAQNEISKIKPSTIYAIGLEGVISDNVLNKAASIANSSAIRIGGTDRYKTSIEISKYFGLSGHGVCIATGNDFPDALAGSVYAANHNVPIILAGSSLSDDTVNCLKSMNITGAVIFGGEGAVNKVIEGQLSQSIGK